LTKAGRETPEHQAQLKRHPAKKATAKQVAARARFTDAARATKGKKMTREQRNEAIARAIHDSKAHAHHQAAPTKSRRGRGSKGKGKGKRGGSYDSYSATSSTRSSDFTSVSDTTSYSMSGGSWSSTDSSSLW
jgi:hypothetical protein